MEENLEEQLKIAEEEFQDLIQERNLVLGQTGVHLSAKIYEKYSKEYDADIQKAREKVEMLRKRIQLLKSNKKEDIEKIKVIEVLKNIFDPDYKDKSIVDMNLVNEDDIKIYEDRIEIEYNLTAPQCPFSTAIGFMIKYGVEKRLNKKTIVRVRKGHYQEKMANEILENEEKYKEMLDKLKEWNLLEKCVKV